MSELDERLSAYVDGDLDAAATAEVEALLLSSDEARTAVEELRVLKSLARETPSAPAFDLWPAIRAGLEEAPAATVTRLRWWRPVLALAAAVLLAWWVLSVRAPGDPSPDGDIAGELAAAHRAYGNAIEKLAVDASDAEKILDAETRARLAESLAVVNRAIVDAERAIAEAPQDPYGHEVLLALYQEKVRIFSATIDASKLGGSS